MLLDKIAKFGVVGIINTIIDFIIFNILSGKRFGYSKIKANFFSTTIAMVFSFFANKRFVFGASGGNFWLQAASFYLVTAFGLYVLQNLVIYIMSHYLKLISNIALVIAGVFGLRKRLGDDFIERNTAKLAATVVSLVWNFVMFQVLVFHL